VGYLDMTYGYTDITDMGYAVKQKPRLPAEADGANCHI